MPRHPTPLTQSASTVYDASASSAHRDYQRQRQMTLGDLLLENRIILLHPLVVPRRRLRRPVPHLLEHLQHRVGLERRPPGQQRVQEHA